MMKFDEMMTRSREGYGKGDIHTNILAEAHKYDEVCLWKIGGVVKA